MSYLRLSYALRASDPSGRLIATAVGMDIAINAERWYALQVRARWEDSTSNLLSNKGYRTFLPTIKAKERRGGRSKEIAAPLFSGYVFCQFDAVNRLPILVTPGVIAVVGRGRIPVPIEDSEVAALQKVVSSGFQPEPWPYLEVGQTIRIEDGALNGLEGILVSFKGSRRIVVSVSLLKRSVSLEIDRTSVSPIQMSRTRDFGSLATPNLLQGALA
jgi:transcription antitermination factor NusG